MSGAQEKHTSQSEGGCLKNVGNSIPAFLFHCFHLRMFQDPIWLRDDICTSSLPMEQVYLLPRPCQSNFLLTIDAADHTSRTNKPKSIAKRIQRFRHLLVYHLALDYLLTIVANVRLGGWVPQVIDPSRTRNSLAMIFTMALTLVNKCIENGYPGYDRPKPKGSC